MSEHEPKQPHWTTAELAEIVRAIADTVGDNDYAHPLCAKSDLIAAADRLVVLEQNLKTIIDNADDFDCGCCIRIADCDAVDLIDRLKKESEGATND